MPKRESKTEEGAQQLAPSTEIEEIFFIFNARDEREPHQFIKYDPLYQQGCVKKWDIQELDMIHTERDDELVVTNKF